MILSNLFLIKMFKNGYMSEILFIFLILISITNCKIDQIINRVNDSYFKTTFIPENSTQIFYYFYKVNGNGDVEIRVTYPYKIEKIYCIKYPKDMPDSELSRLDDLDIYSTGNPYYSEKENTTISYQLFTVDKSLIRYLLFKFSVPENKFLNKTELGLEIFLNEQTIYFPIANSAVIGCVIIYAIFLFFRKK